jgi:hypothetical protein
VALFAGSRARIGVGGRDKPGHDVAAKVSYKVKCHQPVTLVSIRATCCVLPSRTVCVFTCFIFVRRDIMPGQQASKAAASDETLGDDILMHVTPKWVDWYRDTLRRQPDGDESSAAKAKSEQDVEVLPER